MARTYENLRDRALSLTTGSTSVTTLQAVAETGLEESMKYVASKVEIPKLISSATYTWGASDTSANIETDFNITNYQTPELLLVGTSTDKIPYQFRPHHAWNILKNLPVDSARELITGTDYTDSRPSRCWSIDKDDNIILTPINEGQILEFYYTIEPSSYGDGTGYPEIPSLFDHILVSGACLFLQHFILQPEQIINPYSLLKNLDEQIQELSIHLNTKYRTFIHKIPKSYRAS